MKEIVFEVPDNYKYVVLCAVFLCIYGIVMPFVYVVPARLHAFNLKFMEQFHLKH